MGGRNSVFPSFHRQLMARLPDEMYDLVIEDAAARGVTRGDVLAHALAVVYDRPEYDPYLIKPHRGGAATADDGHVPMTA